MTSFADMQRDAALRRVRDESAVRQAITELVLGAGSRRQFRCRVGQIVTVQEDPDYVAGLGMTPAGSYAVEVIERVDKNTEVTRWATAHDGEADSWRWYTVDQALIHLIAARKGQDDHRGDVVTFASRVIGFQDTPPQG